MRIRTHTDLFTPTQTLPYVSNRLLHLQNGRWETNSTIRTKVVYPIQDKYTNSMAVAAVHL